MKVNEGVSRGVKIGEVGAKKGGASLQGGPGGASLQGQPGGEEEGK